MSIIQETLNKLLNSEDLSFGEAKSAMEEIMTGQVSEIKLSSWLAALRIKGECADEIAGCAAIMQAHSTKINCTDENVIDVVGTGGDGTHTINISTTAALIAAGAGITVAKHGNKAVSSSSGSADVLESLGIKIKLSPEQMEKCLNDIGISYLFAPLLHPAMKYAMPVRKDLGIRTIFNILGPLCNPAVPKRMLLGVYDKNLCRLMAEASLNLNAKHILVVHGNDGLDEISISGPTEICEVRNGQITEKTITPEEFGMQISSLESIKGGSPEENAKIIISLLNGQLDGPKKDVVLLNTAAAIFAAGKAESIKEGLAIAGDSVKSGKAKAKLEELVKYTNT